MQSIVAYGSRRYNILLSYHAVLIMFFVYYRVSFIFITYLCLSFFSLLIFVFVRSVLTSLASTASPVSSMCIYFIRICICIRSIFTLRIVGPRTFESTFRNYCAKKSDGALRNCLTQTPNLEILHLNIYRIYIYIYLCI